MKDTLVKALVCEERVRVIVNSTTNLCEEARKRHDCWPTAAAALGRVLSIGSIMGSMQKSENEKVTIQINGGGPIGTIMVDCFPNGDVRGFVSDPYQFYTYNNTGKLAVGVAVGATVGWDNETKTAMIVKDDGTKIDFIFLQIGQATAFVNSEAKALDVPAEISNGRTMVPLRFVIEELGAKVEWEKETSTVKITDK